jgi:hypothetical protein
MDPPEPIPRCSARFEKLLAGDVFAKYPAPVEAFRPVPPDVRHGEALLYRTVLREEAGHAPDFAGHYDLVQIGCGAGTSCPAIEDAKTGEVFFAPQLKNASALLVDTGDNDVETLTYRKDSRLLIVVGTRNEDLKTEGMSYFEWRHDKLTLLRFVPRSKLCGPG